MLTNKSIIDDLKIQGIKPDIAQIKIIDIAVNNQPKKESLLSSFLKKNSSSNNLGIYLWGDVGRGKTAILKTIFKNLDQKKASFHYLDFMKLIHTKLKENKGSKNPLDKVSSFFTTYYEVIFIDEFQVEDVADAMILSHIFNKFIEKDIYIYLTSNAHPDDLYKNGLQRRKFIDVMKLLQTKILVLELDGEYDYRLKNIFKDNKKFETSSSTSQIKSIIRDNFFLEKGLSKSFYINNRNFSCEGENRDFLWVSFEEYFKQPTGASDFSEICKRYKWIFINGFIAVNDTNSDLIRRFITFIDIAYTSNVNIRFFFDNIDPKKIYEGEVLSLLWGRCESRLQEMQTDEYIFNKKN